MKTRDLAPYLMPTRFGASGGVVLGRRLLSTAPKDAPPPVRAAVESVRAETEQLMLHLQARIGTGGPLRMLGAKLVSAWVALRMRLDAVVKAGRPGESERALSLLARALPRGTGFVKLKYAEVWTVSLHHLRRIDEQGLAEEIDAMAGLDLLAWVRERHLALGEALGVAGTPFRQPETRAVQEQLESLADAIAEYGRVLVGHLDLSDADAVTQFRLAMAPLDAHREQVARSRAAGPDAEDEDEALAESTDAASPPAPDPADGRASPPRGSATTAGAAAPMPQAPPAPVETAAGTAAAEPRPAPQSTSILREPPRNNQSGNSAAETHRGGP